MWMMGPVCLQMQLYDLAEKNFIFMGNRATKVLRKNQELKNMDNHKSAVLGMRERYRIVIAFITQVLRIWKRMTTSLKRWDFPLWMNDKYIRSVCPVT